MRDVRDVSREGCEACVKYARGPSLRSQLSSSPMGTFSGDYNTRLLNPRVKSSLVKAQWYTLCGRSFPMNALCKTMVFRVNNHDIPDISWNSSFQLCSSLFSAASFSLTASSSDLSWGKGCMIKLRPKWGEGMYDQAQT